MVGGKGGVGGRGGEQVREITKGQGRGAPTPCRRNFACSMNETGEPSQKVRHRGVRSALRTDYCAENRTREAPGQNGSGGTSGEGPTGKQVGSIDFKDGATGRPARAAGRHEARGSCRVWGPEQRGSGMAAL